MSAVTYKKNNHISIITLNRPEHMNTFNLEMYQEFNAAMANFRDDKDAWVAVVCAAGDKAFSAGVDITSLAGAIAGQSGDQATGQQASISELFDIELEGEYYCDKPIIAAIQGYCIGEGLSMALGCDLRIAGESAQFALPEAKVGMPTINAAIHASRKMGVSNALELLLLGDKRDAHWAYRTGLVNLVVPDDEVQSSALAWAEKIASLSPLANQITKEAAVKSNAQSFGVTASNAAKRRQALQSTFDATEGINAFMEKRPAKYIGA